MAEPTMADLLMAADEMNRQRMQGKLPPDPRQDRLRTANSPLGDWLAEKLDSPDAGAAVTSYGKALDASRGAEEDVARLYAGGAVAPEAGLAKILMAAPKTSAAAGGVGAYLGMMPNDSDAAGGQSKPAKAATPDQLTAETEKRALPDYDPLRDANAEISRLEGRIASTNKRIQEIVSTPIPGNANTALEGRKLAIGPLQKQIDEDMAQLNHMRDVVGKLDVVNKPLREKYPEVAQAATIAGPVAAGLMSRYGLNKISGGLGEAVKKAADATAGMDSLAAVKASQVAGDLASKAPLKQAATIGAAATIPADVQNLMDVTDWKSSPRWTRAYKEADQTFSDPEQFIKKQGPALVSGAVGSLVGAKLAKPAPMAEARSAASSLNGLDDRTTMAKMLQGEAAPEDLAPKLAEKWVNANKADTKAIDAANTAEQARGALQTRRQQQQSGQRTAREADELAPPESNRVVSSSQQGGGKAGGPNQPAEMPVGQGLEPVNVTQTNQQTSKPPARQTKAIADQSSRLTKDIKDEVHRAFEMRLMSGQDPMTISARDVAANLNVPMSAVDRHVSKLQDVLRALPDGSTRAEQARALRDIRSIPGVNLGVVGAAGAGAAAATRDDSSPTGHRHPDGRFAAAP